MKFVLGCLIALAFGNIVSEENARLKKTNEALMNVLQSISSETTVGSDQGSTTLSISSGGIDVEITVVVVGDSNPILTVDSKWFFGNWKTVEEGVEQFYDRKYRLTQIPNHLIGGKYYQGPCHSEGASFTVTSSGTVYVLVSSGEDPMTIASMNFVPEAYRLQSVDMLTESFSDADSFLQWTFSSDWTLLRSNVECGNNENEVDLGTFDSVDACAKACRNRDGCTNFIYGKGEKAGRCWDEAITESACTTWKDAQYDFYGLPDGLRDKLPETGCVMDLVCKNCAAPKGQREARIRIKTFDQCVNACFEDPNCLGMDFGKNGRRWECFLVYLKDNLYIARTPHTDFDAYKKKGCGGGSGSGSSSSSSSGGSRSSSSLSSGRGGGGDWWGDGDEYEADDDDDDDDDRRILQGNDIHLGRLYFRKGYTCCSCVMEIQHCSIPYHAEPWRNSIE